MCIREGLTRATVLFCGQEVVHQLQHAVRGWIWRRGRHYMYVYTCNHHLAHLGLPAGSAASCRRSRQVSVLYVRACHPQQVVELCTCLRSTCSEG